MFRVGLTGGIGSGKSTLAGEFRKLGVAVINLDQISKDLVKPGEPALESIIDHFGEVVLTSEKALDRTALRQKVFHDANERKWLEAMLHPLIRQKCSQLESQLNTPYLIIEIPLLAENIEAQQLDRILVIDVPEELQVQRTMQRSGLSEAEVIDIIGSQASRSERLKVADDLIENAGPELDLQRAALELHKIYLAMAADSEYQDSSDT